MIAGVPGEGVGVAVGVGVGLAEGVGAGVPVGAGVGAAVWDGVAAGGGVGAGVAVGAAVGAGVAVAAALTMNDAVAICEAAAAAPVAPPLLGWTTVMAATVCGPAADVGTANLMRKSPFPEVVTVGILVESPSQVS